MDRSRRVHSSVYKPQMNRKKKENISARSTDRCTNRGVPTDNNSSNNRLLQEQQRRQKSVNMSISSARNSATVERQHQAPTNRAVFTSEASMLLMKQNNYKKNTAEETKKVELPHAPQQYHRESYSPLRPRQHLRLHTPFGEQMNGWMYHHFRWVGISSLRHAASCPDRGCC